MDLDQYLEDCLQVEMTLELQTQLRQIAYNKAFKGFVGLVTQEINGLLNQLVQADIVSEEGRGKAIEIKGQIKGMRRTFDALFEQLIDPEPENVNPEGDD